MLQSLHLKNFKSFRDATVSFGPVTIVLGVNGAGKSNLFDALRFLKAIGEGLSVRDAIDGYIAPGASLATVAGLRGGAGAVTHFLSKSDSFRLEVKLRADGDIITYMVEVDAVKRVVLNEQLKSVRHPGHYVYSTQPVTDPLDQKPDSPVVTARFYKGSRGRNPRRDFSPNEFILSQFVSRKAESRLNELVADTARAEFASLKPLELRPETLRQYSPLGRTELGEHGENFAAVVWQLKHDARLVRVRRTRAGSEPEYFERQDQEAAGRLNAVQEWLSELTPRHITEIDTEAAPTGEVIFAVKEDPFSQTITAPSLSDGTLRFTALALATVGSAGRRTLVVEELENGINPARLELLIRMVEQVAEVDEGVQVIASTHSPTILEYTSPSTIQASLVIGWDQERMTSHPVRLSKVPGIDEALKQRSLGELQGEGWLQLAAEV